MSIAESLLPELEHEAATTRRVLERVPERSFAWQPHPKSMSLHDLAAHIANAEVYRAALTEATDADLRADWTFRAGPKVLFVQPRVAVLRGFVMNH